MTTSTYTVRQVAGKFSLEYRAYLQNASGQVVSPFHDVPLFADEAAGVLNMVVEVPRFSNAKLEISKSELMNPIVQDVKKGALRFVKNCFPYHGYLWNYGAFPQTWESPAVLDHDTGLKGDNDPIDVIEIGSAVAKIGEVKQVKVLGALAMLDEGETDWKIIAIDVTDPLASQLNDSSDLERVCPGLVEATRRWFEVYKIPDGKPANSFAFNGEVKNKAFAMNVIRSVNQMWKELMTGKGAAEHSISIISRVSDNVDEAKIPKEGLALPDNSVSESVHTWAFIPPHH
ncbi:putative inorganic pyrophosphatase [Paramicrosporidium saccamoebae]|uniref:Inorganic pyrophosphatase n=1 Tax=Paramicrosporidium saccamoebae TaxID=1246581 RepID=A0A2H9TH32_9FUNG|nr:putative inorganic pyrophosphatase [Paramicrosporidium saccamoebae]